MVTLPRSDHFKIKNSFGTKTNGYKNKITTNTMKKSVN